MRCKQSHDYEPEKCKVCGRTEFRAYGTDSEREQEVLEAGPAVDELTTERDVSGPSEEDVSFSNVSELGEWERDQADESDVSSGPSVWLLLSCS
jgi:hypothetical protein